MSSYSFTFAFECKESKSVKKKRLCEMPGAKIAPLVPRKVRGQFFSPAFCFPLDKSNEKGITHIIIKSNWRRSYFCIHSVDLPFDIQKKNKCLLFVMMAQILPPGQKDEGCSSEILNSTPSLEILNSCFVGVL